MSEVWLLEAYDDPYIAPHTIGVFESKEQLVETVVAEYSDAKSIEWGTDRALLTFEIRSMYDNKLIRYNKERFDFRQVKVGEILE